MARRLVLWWPVSLATTLGAVGHPPPENLAAKIGFAGLEQNTA